MLHITLPSDASPWTSDWAWGIPLIIFTLLIHVAGLSFVIRIARREYSRGHHRETSLALAVLALAATSFVATVLHAFETAAWAATYCFLGALPNFKSAMLFSLGAMTTYGQDTFTLRPHWRMLGSIEALNGWLLFGLSTAFLFSLIQTFASAHNADPGD